MGICTKLTLFEEVANRKRGNWRKIEEDQRRKWRDHQRKRRAISWITKEARREWGNEKELRSPKRNRKDGDGEKAEGRRSRETSTINC